MEKLEFFFYKYLGGPYPNVSQVNYLVNPDICFQGAYVVCNKDLIWKNNYSRMKYNFYKMEVRTKRNSQPKGSKFKKIN